MSEWTDELKQEVIEAYESANPTPETSVEIVAQLAEDYDKTPNGIRMILTKAGVYVKKSPSNSSAKGESKSGGTRVSKADAIGALKDAISAAGAEVDDEILDKLTGKAAVYLTSVIQTTTSEG